jgi:DNA-dependent RNA polymerase auxiliary subunit epsilon
MFPLILFTGANAPTTIDRFPRGEAIHYREHAMSLGVPDQAIVIETQARNTVENITNTRQLLADRGYQVESVTLISRPYQQRRAYNITRKLWSDVDVVCSVQPIDLRDYLDQIGDTDLVLDTLVGDSQRVGTNGGVGRSLVLPRIVLDAYHRLVAAGFTRRLIT